MTVLERLKAFYQQLSIRELHLLSDVYSNDIVFSDPVNTFNGLESLTHYFEKLMGNCKNCRFSFHDAFFDTRSGWIQWTMYFRHPRLNHGNEIKVDGVSFFSVKDSKIISQRDYYDLGEMLYEQVPLLGALVTGLKKRMQA